MVGELREGGVEGVQLEMVTPVDSFGGRVEEDDGAELWDEERVGVFCQRGRGVGLLSTQRRRGRCLALGMKRMNLSTGLLVLSESGVSSSRGGGTHQASSAPRRTSSFRPRPRSTPPSLARPSRPR